MGTVCCSDDNPNHSEDFSKPTSVNQRDIRLIEDISAFYSKQKEIKKESDVFEVTDL